MDGHLWYLIHVGGTISQEGSWRIRKHDIPASRRERLCSDQKTGHRLPASTKARVHHQGSRETAELLHDISIPIGDHSLHSVGASVRVHVCKLEIECIINVRMLDLSIMTFGWCLDDSFPSTISSTYLHIQSCLF